MHACLLLALTNIPSLSLSLRLPGRAQQPDVPYTRHESGTALLRERKTLNLRVFVLLSLNALTSAYELSESSDLWPFIPMKTSLDFKNARAPMRKQAIVRPGRRAFYNRSAVRYTTT